MKSVADELREEQQARIRALPIEERIRLAIQSGERGLIAFQRAHGLDRRSALLELQRIRQKGRQPSGCIDALLGDQ